MPTFYAYSVEAVEGFTLKAGWSDAPGKRARGALPRYFWPRAPNCSTRHAPQVGIAVVQNANGDFKDFTNVPACHSPRIFNAEALVLAAVSLFPYRIN